jgi:hypothetical protein
MSRHETRQELALGFGATDIIEERGDAGVARVRTSPTDSALTPSSRPSARRNR